MAYTTVEAVKREMRKLPTSITDTEISNFINKADAYIEAVLGVVFMTPLALPPKIIEMIATDLTVYFLAESLFGSQTPNMMDENYKARFERANSLLEKILIGDIYTEMPKKENLTAGYATTNDQQIFNYEDPEW
jgi:phage gp36-like protein